MKALSWAWYAGSLVVLWLAAATATYLGWNPKANSVDPHKENHSHQKRYGPFFKHDRDISKYTKLFGTDMMLWRCRNAIQPYWNWKPLKEVELYCEVIGRIRHIEWYHNGKKIKLGGRYRESYLPHYASRHFFSKWIDIRLHIFNATQRDSGIYSFRAISPTGYSEKQVIYVDISEKKKKKRKRMKSALSRPDRKLAKQNNEDPE